jgi:hypothetical protein
MEIVIDELKDQDGDAGGFAKILSSMAGHRLTYKELIGEDAPTAATV